MPELRPETLILGGLDANDGSTYVVERFYIDAPELTAGARAHQAAFGSLRTYLGERNTPQRFELTWVVDGSTVAIRDAAAKALEEKLESREKVQFKEVGRSTELFTYIETVAPPSKQTRGDWTRLIACGTLQPSWYKALTALVECDVSAGYGYAPYTIAGTKPAPCRVYAAMDDSGNTIAMGQRSAPSANYDPIDDYSGTAEDGAQPDYGNAHAVTTLPAAWGTVGTTPTIDIDANIGSVRPVIRCKSGHDVAAQVDIRTTSVVGAGATASTTTGAAVHPTTTGATAASVYELVVCPPMPIPGGGVPTGRDSWYAASATLISQATEDSNVTIPTGAVGQVFTLDHETILESITWKLASDAVAPLSTYVYGYDTGTNKTTTLVAYSLSQDINIQAAAEVTHTMEGTPAIQAGVYVALCQRPIGSATVTARYKGTASSYAGGTRVVGIRAPDSTMTEYANDDMYFKVVGQESLSLVCSMPIQVQETSADAATFYTDLLVRIPQDEGCVIATGMGLDADYGIQADNMSLVGEPPDVYLFNRGAAGANLVPVNSVMADVVTYFPFELRPGIIWLVVASDQKLDNSVFVGGAYYPTYATPLEVT